MDIGPIHRNRLDIIGGQFFISMKELDKICPEDYPGVGDILWVRLVGYKTSDVPTAFEIAGAAEDSWWLIKVDWLDAGELSNRWEDRRHALAATAA